MTKEKRIIKNERRKQDAIIHRDKRNAKYKQRISEAQSLDCPLNAITKYGPSYWENINSSTGYSQICSYQGICQYPCNGDC